MWCLATLALCQPRCPLVFRSGTQTCSRFRLEDTTAPVAGPAGRDSLVCLLTNLARGPHHTDPQPWHGAGSPSRDSLSFPVTHSCPATHSFHPYSFPLLLYSQMEFQELSGQLVLIPMLIPSGFWECSLLFAHYRQCSGEAIAQGFPRAQDVPGNSPLCGICRRGFSEESV